MSEPIQVRPVYDVNCRLCRANAELLAQAQKRERVLRAALTMMRLALMRLNHHHTHDHHDGHLECLDPLVSDAFLAYREVVKMDEGSR